MPGGEEWRNDRTKRTTRRIGGDRKHKGHMAAAAAMATIGVVKQAGQLSHERERLSAREAACLLPNAVQVLFNRVGFPFPPLGGATAPRLIKNSLTLSLILMSVSMNGISSGLSRLQMQPCHSETPVFLCWCWIRAGEMYWTLIHRFFALFSISHRPSSRHDGAAPPSGI